MNWMVRVQVLQSKADALAPQPQPDRKWEVGSAWTMLVNQILHHRNHLFCLVFMLKINPSHSLWLRVLEPRAFGGVPLRRFRNALADDHGVCWAFFEHTSDVAQSFNYKL